MRKAALQKRLPEPVVERRQVAKWRYGRCGKICHSGLLVTNGVPDGEALQPQQIGLWVISSIANGNPLELLTVEK